MSKSAGRLSCGCDGGIVRESPRCGEKDDDED